MTDTFDQLTVYDTAEWPRPRFSQALRSQLLDALDLSVADISLTPQSSALATRNRPMPSPLAAITLTPYLSVHDAAAAIDFYVNAFGGVEDYRVVGDDGKVGHAEITFGAVKIMLADEYPDWGSISPRTVGGTPVTLHLEVPDCDAIYEAALAGGSEGDRPPSDQSHGSRTASLTDPFGHRWMFSQALGNFDLETYATNVEDEFTVEPGSGSA